LLRLFLAIAFLYGVAESVYGNWAVLHLTEERGLDVAAAGLALAAFWAALTVGRFAVAALVLHVPPARVLPVLAALMRRSRPSWRCARSRSRSRRGAGNAARPRGSREVRYIQHAS
jgi:hypothetical protein